MSHPSPEPSPDATENVSAATRLDQICDQFVRAWRGGQRQRIEDQLSVATDVTRDDLLAALIREEIVLRRKAGEELRVEEFVSRFPRDRETVARVFDSTGAERGTDTTLDPTRSRLESLRDVGDTLSIHDAEAPPSGCPAVPGYRVRYEIARGGMGCVLAAFDLTLERDVAIKILLPGANADRFVRESKITARLPHPGIPPVHALGTLPDNSPFLAMKLIAGHTLADTLKTTDRPRLLQVFTQVCQAVGFAHNRGVIHRDLKPINIMVGAFGEVQVMDWGLAKDLTSHEKVDGSRSSESLTDLTIGADANETTTHQEPGQSSDDRTRIGTILGTPAYMAPEQARGEATDARSDVFALGGILCTILTGQPPFRGKSPLDVIRRAGAADLAEANARLDVCGADADLLALCRRCLSPNPCDRPASGQDVADGVTAYLNSVQERLQTVERERAVAVAREAEHRKRRRTQLALATAIGLLVAGGASFAWWQNKQATDRLFDQQRADGVLKAEQAAFDAERKLKGEQARQRTENLLELANVARREYRYTAAESSLREAGELAAALIPDMALAVEEARADLAFVRELDAVRMKRSIWTSDPQEGGRGRFSQAAAPAEYRAVFLARGLDLAADPEAAGARMVGSAVRPELVAALDDWAVLETDATVRDRVLAAARRVDPGPVMAQIRDSSLWQDGARLQAVTSAIDPARLTPGGVVAIAELMRAQGLDPIPLLRHAISVHPRDFLLPFTLGQMRLNGRGFKDPEEAVGAFRTARAIRPDNVAVLSNLGNALRDRGDLAGAMAVCREAIRLDPTLGPAHHNLGNALQLRKEYAAAAVAYREAIRLDPQSGESHSGLAEVLRAQGDLPGALAASRESLRLEPGNSNFHVTLGNTLHGMADHTGAAAAYREGARLDPKSALAPYGLGRVLEDLKDNSGAVAAYRTAILNDPQYHPARTNLGIQLARNGDHAGALVEFREALRLDPKNPVYHANLGRCLTDLKDLDGALDAYRGAILLDPAYARAHYAVGVLLMERKDMDGAIDAYRSAIRADPTYAAAHFNLGLAFDKSGNTDRAIEAYRDAIRVDPKYVKALYNLGNAWRDKRDLSAAVAAYQEAIRINPLHVNAQFNLGLALRDLGDLPGADTQFREVARLDPKDADASIHIAQVERLAAARDKLDSYQNGSYVPATNEERLGLAEWCQIKKLHRTATGVYVAAFAADPKLADDLQSSHRYNAACSAARAAVDQGGDAANLDEEERTRLRRQAYDWLNAELALRAKQLESGKPADRAEARRALLQWQRDTDLTSLRDAAELEKLAAEERTLLTQFWTAVAELLQRE